MKSFVVGEGSGLTAKELNITQVAHATGARGLKAYESIINDPSGIPTLVEASNNEVGVPGGGFFTAIGNEGEHRSGEYTVRLKPLPEARDGTDFIFLKDRNWVVIKNPLAFRIISNPITLSPVEYFKFFAEGNIFPWSNSGELQSYERRLFRDSLRFSPSMELEITKIVFESLINPDLKPETKILILKNWIKLPISAKYDMFLYNLIKKGEINPNVVFNLINNESHW